MYDLPVGSLYVQLFSSKQHFVSTTHEISRQITIICCNANVVINVFVVLVIVPIIIITIIIIIIVIIKTKVNNKNTKA